jgi:hypothetical protein
MNKLMPYFGAALLGLFALGVFAVVISLSFSGLGRIFPDSLFDQAVGLVLFDAAALVWFVTFIYKSDGLMQYVFAGFGFLVGLVGVIGLVGIEVGISSGMMKAAEMTKPLTYIFIGAAVGHLVLLYLHHGSEPATSAKISLGVEKAKIVAEGMRQSDEQLAQMREQMGATIRARLVADMLRDLNMPVQVIDGKLLPVDDSLHVPSNGWPVREPEKKNFPLSLDWWRGLKASKSSPVEAKSEQVIWVQLPDGQRERVVCMICRGEGKPWDTKQPCSHVLNGQGRPINLESSVPVASAASGIAEVYDPAHARIDAGKRPTGGGQQ